MILQKYKNVFLKIWSPQKNPGIKSKNDVIVNFIIYVDVWEQNF